jgi:hypothetical protein
LSEHAIEVSVWSSPYARHRLIQALFFAG